ncbi:PaaI family thioesterase [Cupriavidus sp. 2TAF22]|uniref:PaaI family thioesterase n=1 Tax=unclassified Cupriavidus TaxID=2640874 RepID=UPI003F92DD72
MTSASMALEGAQEDVPAGFEPLITSAGFLHTCGQFYMHTDQPVVGFRVGREHLNLIGIAHGGFLATVADVALGAVVRRDLAVAAAPTVHLSIDYVGAVQPGDWVQAHVRILKDGRKLINADCDVRVGERVVLHASGAFFVKVRAGKAVA